MSSMDLEVVKEESIQLQLEHEGGANESKTSGGGDVDVAATTSGALQDLTSSIQKLTLKGDGGGGVQKEQMSELISKLEKARMETADGERQARKASWKEEQAALIRDIIQFKGQPEKLPKAVWKGVLLKVNDSSKDRARVSKMSEMWRDLLKKDRTKFLFHEVLPLLHGWGRMSTNNLLRIRRVCKEWKSSTDTFLQTTQDFSIIPEEDAIKSVSRSSNREPVLELWFPLDIPAVKRFLRWSKRTYHHPGGNPFVTRNLCLGKPTGYPPPPLVIQAQIRLVAHMFWAEVERLLKRWGREVWQVILIFEGRLHPAELYDRLCKMLKLMPNLKSLVLQKDIEESDVNPEKDMSYIYEVLEKRMTENPLPEMGHLHTIIGPLVHPPILKEMLRKFGPTLETLSTGAGIGVTLNAYANTRLPRFKQFFISSGDCIVPESGINVEWPSIEEIGFMLKEIAASSIRPLFQFLNGFGGTLKKLTLVLHNEEGPLKRLKERAVKMLSLELPHLEEFTFSVCRINLKTIDFMLPMTSLKVLSVNYVKFVASFPKKEQRKNSGPSKAPAGTSVDDSGEMEIIKFSNYTDRLYESNIWKVFPELKKVSITIVDRLKNQQQNDEEEEKTMVKRKTYTVEGYKQHCSEL